MSLNPRGNIHPAQYAGKSPTIKVTRGRSRKLSLLPDMPYDIVVEILGHLGPHDLLRLARTSKDWRRSLMNRSSEGIWRLARSRLDDMPDLPPGMSEPEYANLMFSTHCHYCLAPRVQLVIWTTLRRACKACFPVYYRRSSNLGRELGFFHLPNEVWRFAELQGNIIRSTTYTPITSRERPRKIASVELLERLNTEYNAIRGQHDQVQLWLKQKEEEHGHKTRITDAFEAWHELQRQKRTEELVNVRNKRKDMIIQKLEEHGWKEEIEAMDVLAFRRLHHHDKVHVARELTEGVWTNIAPVLFRFMDSVKAERLGRLRVQQISNRRRLFATYITELETKISTILPGFFFAPPVTDLSTIPFVRDIIEETPLDHTITKDAFEPFRKQLRDMSHGWALYQSHELLKLMPKSAADTSNNEISRLWLATTLFKCDRVQDPIPYGDIFVHPGASSYIPWKSRAGLEERGLFEDFHQEFWNHNQDRVSFHEQASQAARCIVEMCNLDPAATTAKDMDASNPFIGCASCRDPDNPLNDTLIMTWRRAVIHALEHNNGIGRPLWVPLHANTQADWYREALTRVRSESPVYRCHMCDEYGDKPFIMSHLPSRHPPYVFGRLHPIPDPPSAFWVSSPITSALGAY